MELLNEIFTTQGRLNRFAYLKYQVTLALISALVGFFASNAETLLITLPAGIWSLAATVGSVMLSIRRLHDLDKSGLMLLLVLIPLIDIIFLIYLWLAPGTVGRNRFGEDPLAQ